MYDFEKLNFIGGDNIEANSRFSEKNPPRKAIFHIVAIAISS